MEVLFMALFIARAVGIARGGARPSWMPKPANDFGDMSKIVTLLRAIPAADGGKKEAWANPANMPALPINGGTCPSELADAIFSFQKLWLEQGEINIADGVVDQHGRTIRKLNALVKDIGSDVGGMSNIDPEGQIDTTACWAASLSWMSRATPGQNPTPQLQILTLNATSFGVSGTISKSDLLTANAGGVLLTKKRGSAADLEKTVRAGIFPLLVGFSSGPMSGHVNVIHGFNPATSEVEAMEPWFADPSKNPAFTADNSTGMLVYTNNATGAPFKFTGAHVKRPLSYYTSKPLGGEFILAIPASSSFP